MSDIRLFDLSGDTPSPLTASHVPLERTLQSRIEQNMETFLGVRFLASEYSIPAGRLDSLGIDENHAPVIIEYKRASHENIINQGLFYLDWLMDHRRDFEWLVLSRYGEKPARDVDWENPRLICIAGDFTRYDIHAVNQMNRNIDLLRYRQFGEDLLLLEILTATSRNAPRLSSPPAPRTNVQPAPARPRKTFRDLLADASPDIGTLYELIRSFILSLGDDIQDKILEHYEAFRRMRNFACIVIKPQAGHIKVYLKLNPDSIPLQKGFSHDMRGIGHFGTGDLEVIITDHASFERAQPLIEQSYNT